MNHNQNDGLLKMIRRTDSMIFLIQAISKGAYAAYFAKDVKLQAV